MQSSLGKSYKIEVFPEEKKLIIELSLKEENQPIFISGNYQIAENKIQIQKLNCSKVWIQEFISFYTKKNPPLSISLEHFLAELLNKFL